MAKPLTAPLNEPEVIAEWRTAITKAIDTDDGKDAEAFVRFYDDFLKRNVTFANDFPDAAKAYADMYEKALWLSFPYLSERDGVGMFEKRLAAAFSLPAYDFAEKMRQWLVNFPLERRDEIKQKIYAVVTKASARATAGDIVGEEGSQEGTVANWIRDYQRAVGIDKADPLKESQYFFSNRAFNALPTEEREKLRRLFTLLGRLNISSLDPKGYEEEIVLDEDGTQVVVFEGQEIETPKDAGRVLRSLRTGTPEEDQQRLIALLKGSEEEVQAINALEQEYVTASGNDPEKLRDALHALLALQPGQKADPHRTVALLKQLARANRIEEILRSDKRFFDLLEKRYTAMGKQPKVDDLKVYPTSPSHLSAFFQIVLIEQAGLTPSEAARYVVQVGNIIRKMQQKEKYLGIAYFDDDTETFRFAEPLREAEAG